MIPDHHDQVMPPPHKTASLRQGLPGKNTLFFGGGRWSKKEDFLSSRRSFILAVRAVCFVNLHQPVWWYALGFVHWVGLTLSNTRQYQTLIAILIKGGFSKRKRIRSTMGLKHPIVGK